MSTALQEMFIEQLGVSLLHAKERLASRHNRELDQLVGRLERIRSSFEEEQAYANAPARRSPRSPPKPCFQNPDSPTQTWSGRGRRPNWIKAQLESGRHLNEFRIRP